MTKNKNVFSITKGHLFTFKTIAYLLPVAHVVDAKRLNQGDGSFVLDKGGKRTVSMLQ